VPVLLKIPFDRKVAEAYAKGGTLLEAMPELEEKLNEVFLEIVGLKR
jgi:MinD superfamily P-loop ATPase